MHYGHGHQHGADSASPGIADYALAALAVRGGDDDGNRGEGGHFEQLPDVARTAHRGVGGFAQYDRSDSGGQREQQTHGDDQGAIGADGLFGRLGGFDQL